MASERWLRSRRQKATWVARFAWLAAAVGVAYASAAQAQVVAGSSVYVRTDTDKTTVIAPRLHVGAPVTDRTRVDLVYTADVWTSASIDIRTSASKAVTEQRDEINTTVTQEFDDVSLSATYRYSHEYDYESHGGNLTGSYSFADKSATLDFRLSATFDAVGRAGDPHFDRDVTNLAGRLGFTQLLDSETYVQVFYELMSANGYNASAYRFIGLGTPLGLCPNPPKPGQPTSPNSRCIAETNPSERLRHALAANLRRALGDHVSFGVGYRFYIDSWAVSSHTGLLELNYTPDHDHAWLFGLRYRFYMQGSAKQYKRTFETSDINLQYYSNDKELSKFMSHRIALDIERVFALDDVGHQLTVVLSFAPSFFSYDNYAPLSQITAFESTLATVFKL